MIRLLLTIAVQPDLIAVFLMLLVLGSVFQFHACRWVKTCVCKYRISEHVTDRWQCGSVQAEWSQRLSFLCRTAASHCQ